MLDLGLLWVLLQSGSVFSRVCNLNTNKGKGMDGIRRKKEEKMIKTKLKSTVYLSTLLAFPDLLSSRSNKQHSIIFYVVKREQPTFDCYVIIINNGIYFSNS